MDRTQLFAYVEETVIHQSETNQSRRIYNCKLCGKTMAHKYNLLSHVESIHFPNTFLHQCSLCERSYGTKKALDQHVLNHRRLKL